MAGSPAVVVDHRQTLRQLLEDAAQNRMLPLHRQVAERHPGNEDQRVTIAGDRIRQAHIVGASRVPDARNRHHAVEISRACRSPCWRGTAEGVMHRMHHGPMEANGRAWIEELPDEIAGQRELLRRLVTACETNSAIRWLVVACSVCRGVADRFSDLDMGLGVRDDAFESTFTEIRRIVDGLGDLVESYYHQLPGLTMRHERIFAQYADRCQVDLMVFPASQTFQVRDQVVLYDQDKLIAGSFEQQPVTADQVREWAFGGWGALPEFGTYLRRGSAWEALQRLHDARDQVWRLWATVLDVPNPQYGVTSILDFAPDRLPAAMVPTASDLDRDSLLAAARSLGRQLNDVCARLRPDQRIALPEAMARYITRDLAEISQLSQPAGARSH